MSNEEAIQMLENIRDYLCSGNPVWRTDVIRDAVNMAIVALNNDEPQTYVINPQEPTNDDKCFECDDFFTCGGQCNKVEDEPHRCGYERSNRWQ